MNESIGVLMGGFSREREVSLASGRAVAGALEARGHDVRRIDVAAIDGPWRDELLECDVAFIALHGGFGEGGRLQRRLERHGIRFTGSGSRASALCLDKAISKMILRSRGVSVPRGLLVDHPWKSSVVVQRVRLADLGWPIVLKPRREGSSIGVQLIHSLDELPVALDASVEFEDGILIEEFIDGRELTVGMLAHRPLPVVELVPKNEFFDYQAKYSVDSGTEYLIEHGLPAHVCAEVQSLAARAHALLGCLHLSRVDLMLDSQMRPYVLEVNTIPGFTETSLLPKAAAASGLGFAALCETIVRMALEQDRCVVSGHWRRSITGTWRAPSGRFHGRETAETA